MGHNKHPETKEFIHHWIVSTDIIHLHDGDEGYYSGTCKVQRCNEIKYFPTNPAVTYQSSWLKTRREKAEEKFHVK